MSESSSSWTQFLHPKYWPVWLWLGFLRLVILLPFPALLTIGRALGRLAYSLRPKRVDVARKNIRHCFPSISDDEMESLAKRHFESMGISFFETALCWWASQNQLDGLVDQINGLEHIQQAQADKQGVILLGAHFTDMEICLRLLSLKFPFAPVYRKMNNPLLEHFTSKGRNKNTAGAIAKQDMKRSVRHLRNGGVLWFAPDQQHQGSHSSLVDFFGQPAHSATSTSNLARVGKAKVVTVWFARNENGYRVDILPPLEDFPCGDGVQDTERYHQLIEAQVLRVPEQYLWTHKRFKDAPGMRY
ncbi:MAG: lipid A biosynthesis acyltransferase [Motiliproteus sp.]|nr:lipid A biosynthesis acyltransferase [Motiliproteus sp.]MCW9053762.1 lipid A biosynthesis acyltransferase [Motiliproteus sp.]